MSVSKLLNDPEPVFTNSSWGRTTFDVKVFSYKWDLLYFMSLPKKTFGYYEINIPTGGKSTTYWNLRVYPNGKDLNHKDYVSVHVYYSSLHYGTFKTRYSIELRGGFDNVIVSRNCECVEFSSGSEHGFSDCIKRETLQKALEKSVNGTLTILCTIKEFTNIRNEAQPPGIPVQPPKEAYSTNVLKTLLTDKAYSDFTINVKQCQFEVHKAILHACSPVFAAMLNTKMKEREKNETTVDDVEPDVFEKMLEFMYTGNVATINAHAIELLPVAHKYDLKALMEQCEIVLCSQISIKMSVKLFVLSNVYSLKYLKNATIKCINTNLREISQTADWKAYVENDPNFLKLLLMT